MDSYQNPTPPQPPATVIVRPAANKPARLQSASRAQKISAAAIGYTISTLSMVNDTLAFISGSFGDISKMSGVNIIPTLLFSFLDLLPNITYTNKAVGSYLGVPSDDKKTMETEEIDLDTNTLTPATRILWLSISVPGALFDGCGAIYNFGLTTSNTMPPWGAYTLGTACASNTFLSEGTETSRQMMTGRLPAHAWPLRIIPYLLGAATLVPEVITTYLPVANFFEVSEPYKLPLFVFVIYTNGVGDFCYNTAEQCTGFWVAFWESLRRQLPDGKTIFDFTLSGGVSVWINWMLASNFLRYQTELSKDLPFSMTNEFVNNFFWGCLLIRNSINGTAYLYDYFPTATTIIRDSTSRVLTAIGATLCRNRDNKGERQALLKGDNSLAESPTGIATYTERRPELATPPQQTEQEQSAAAPPPRQSPCSRLSFCSIM